MNIYHSYPFFLLLCAAVLALHLLWTKLPRRAGKVPGRIVLDAVFCLCLGITVGTLFVLYPGNRLEPNGDSAVFLYVGREMLAGKAPYRDLFDHKGPLLYLIQWLGLRLGNGGTAGLWLLEAANMALTAAFLLRVGTLADENRGSVYPAVLMTLVACGWWLYEGGNFVEEYALPWISMALWVLLRFLKTDEVRPGQIVLLGAAFLAVLMLRPNMVAVWAALMPVVLIRFLRQKRWRDLLRSVLFFFAGAAAVALPMLVWLRRLGCLREMLDCYVSFNFAYTDDVGLNGGTVWGLSKIFLRLLLPGVVAMAVSLVAYRREKLQWLNLWVFAVSLLMVEMSGRDYPHYLIAQLPALTLGLTGFFRWAGGVLQKNQPAEPDRLLMLLSCIAMLLGAVGYHAVTGRSVYPEREAAVWLKENTNPQDDVLVLGNDAGLYLSADRRTENRYFYQTPPITISPELYADFMRELEERPSDVVVMSGNSVPTEGWRKDVMDFLLAEGYSLAIGDGFGVFIR